MNNAKPETSGRWKDISSFSQRDKVREPRTFVMEVAGLSITVTRHMHYAPTDWLLCCDPFFREVVIGTGTADDAKVAAIKAVKQKLIDTLAALGPCPCLAP